MKNLASKGLSMSQATSISNLCNQRAAEIENKLSVVNNCSKVLEFEGKALVAQQGNKLPSDVIDLIIEKGRLHATQAFLMENITEKDRLLKDKQRERFTTKKEAPAYPEFKTPEVLPLVKEDWGWGQLSANDMAEYIEAEAYAAHIGKFIHKGSILDRLRKELPEIKTLEWMTTPGEKGKSYPMLISVHHSSEDLLTVHEELAAKHRIYEQKVNYYKSKVKNLVTDENARISRVNADNQAAASKENAVLRAEYDAAVKAYNEEIQKDQHEFEAERQKAIKEIAALRIEVHPTFQDVIDEFMKKLDDSK